MDCTSARIPYRQTNAFTKIALDYIDQAETLKPFFAHPPHLQGIQKAMEARKKNPVNRKLLVDELKKQYDGIATSDSVIKHIDALLSDDTFTVTTAHQNNIFTGPLYFIYKIIHAIRLADHLKQTFPKQNFVPVFFIGSEDADLEELNHIYFGSEKITWQTTQTGAVGRMKIDKALIKLIERMDGQLSVLPHGKEIVDLLKKFYKEDATLQEATFRFVNHLFAEYGLVVLLPDNAAWKKQMIKIFEDDLLKHTASGIVENTTKRLQEAGYRTQVNPREINLFYLKENKRERIIKKGARFKTESSSLDLSEEELLEELNKHPDRFSPNVILRGLYQEMILPNVAFIGGAGETSYWLQLKDLFDQYHIPFPVLVLRNSFLIVEKKWKDKISKLGFEAGDFFLPEQEIINRLVIRESKNKTKLNGSMSELQRLYEGLKKQAKNIDDTLGKHVDALKIKAMQRLRELEKKMLRAEKRKFTGQEGQVHTIKQYLFPGEGLQERRYNLCYYYAKWGSAFLQNLYNASLCLEQEFVIIAEK